MELSSSAAIADRIREVFLNGTWVANTNYQQLLEGVSREEALQRPLDLNSIARLTFHIDYYLGGLLQVLQGGPLEIRDRFSFDLPPIKTEAEWRALVTQLRDHAVQFTDLVAQLSDAELDGPFVEAKYGSWRRNLEGLIEHSYYHMGQVALIRKLVRAGH